MLFRIFLVISFLIVFFRAWAQEEYIPKRKAQKLYDKAKETQKARDINGAEVLYLQAYEADTNFMAPLMSLLTIYEASQMQKEAFNVSKPLALRATLKECYRKFGLQLMLATKEAIEGNDHNVEVYLKAAEQAGEAFNKNDRDRHNLAKRALQYRREQYGKGYRKPELAKLPEPMNRFKDQYFPIETADGKSMIFTAIDKRGSVYDENIYVTELDKGRFSQPRLLSRNLFSAENEGTCTISADGSVLVFTACNDNLAAMGSCDLYISYKNGDEYTVPKPLNEVNSKNWDSQPSLSPDGKTLFFCSMRPGGEGATDIWYSVRTESGWQAPKNMGPMVNTPYDEYSVFIHPNNKTIFFSSDGHPGYGMQDIFIATINRKYEVYNVQNAGQSLNTARNETGISISADGKRGYISQEVLVPGSMTSTKIFAFRPDPQWNLPKATVLPLVIKDKENNSVIDASLTMNSLSFSDMPLRYDFNKSAKVLTAALPDSGTFYYEAEAKGYMPKGGMIKISEGKNDTLVVSLDKIMKGAIARFNNILFASGSADLLPEAEPELSALFKLLNENQQVKIRIDGHTDDVGEASANLNLSKLRAAAVQSYLVKQGVAKERLQVMQFGESKPVSDNQTEEGRRINRRIEILIL